MLLRFKYGVDLKRLSREEERVAHAFIMQELVKEFYQLSPVLQFGVKKDDLVGVVFPWFKKEQEKQYKEIEEAMQELDKYEFYARPL